jgi:hypothetical protein
VESAPIRILSLMVAGLEFKYFYLEKSDERKRDSYCDRVSTVGSGD